MSESETEQKTRSPTANHFVGFIDIMGFKNWVARSLHDEIYCKMREIVDYLKDQELPRLIPDSTPRAQINSQFITPIIFSDSIMLFSVDDSCHSAEEIQITMSNLATLLIEFGIPHKGALAFGKMTLDYENSIFFGQPMIDAYLLQEELAMYGIVVHSSAEKKLSGISSYPHTTYLYDYPCPFKDGNARHFIIPPLYCSKQYNGTDGQAAFVSEFKKFRHTTSGHIRKYLDNTEAYLKAYNPDLNFDV